MADLADHNCLLYAYSIFDPEFYFILPAIQCARLSGNLVTINVAVMSS
jgi:hypothetical protein